QERQLRDRRPLDLLAVDKLQDDNRRHDDGGVEGLFAVPVQALSGRQQKMSFAAQGSGQPRHVADLDEAPFKLLTGAELVVRQRLRGDRRSAQGYGKQGGEQRSGHWARRILSSRTGGDSRHSSPVAVSTAT